MPRKAGGTGCPKARVAGGCEPPNAGAWDKTSVLCKSNSYQPLSSLSPLPACLQLTLIVLTLLHTPVFSYFLGWTEFWKSKTSLPQKVMFYLKGENPSFLWEGIRCLSRPVSLNAIFWITRSKASYSNARTECLGDTQKWFWIIHCFSSHRPLLSTMEDNWTGGFAGRW